MLSIDVKKAFGTAIKDWRNQLGLSQEQLAERADLHRTYVSSVERGIRNVSLENIIRLARALEISVAALFPAGPAAHKVPSPPAGSTQNIVDVLLIEDNPDDAAIALDAFQQARFTNCVRVINDGAVALDYLFCRGKYSRRRVTDRPQVILLDLNLPGVDGIEVLRRLKTDRRTKMIPVIILTISEKDTDMAECLRLGAAAFIVKPINFQRLSQATPQLNLDWVLLRPRSGKSRNVET